MANINLRMTDLDKDVIEQRASQRGMNTSSHIMALINKDRGEHGENLTPQQKKDLETSEERRKFLQSGQRKNEFRHYTHWSGNLIRDILRFVKKESYSGSYVNFDGVKVLIETALDQYTHMPKKYREIAKTDRDMFASWMKKDIFVNAMIERLPFFIGLDSTTGGKLQYLRKMVEYWGVVMKLPQLEEHKKYLPSKTDLESLTGVTKKWIKKPLKKK